MPRRSAQMLLSGGDQTLHPGRVFRQAVAVWVEAAAPAPHPFTVLGSPLPGGRSLAVG